MTDQTREDFEAWMVNKAKIIIGSTDPYPSGLERDYWRVWQAATVAERERCALVCDEHPYVDNGGEWFAAAIRQPLHTGTGEM